MTNRSRIARAFAFVLVFAIAAALLAPTAFAKSYHFTSVDTRATVQSNGDIRIVEDRTARFVGSFSELWYVLPLSGTDGLAMSAFTTLGAGRAELLRGERTFKVEQRRKATIYIYYGEQRDARSPGVHAEERDVWDTAELYWKTIGTGWDVGLITSGGVFPAGVSQEELRVWAHGLYRVRSQRPAPRCL